MIDNLLFGRTVTTLKLLINISTQTLVGRTFITIATSKFTLICNNIEYWQKKAVKPPRTGLWTIISYVHISLALWYDEENWTMCWSENTLIQYPGNNKRNYSVKTKRAVKLKKAKKNVRGSERESVHRKQFFYKLSF